jgi:hypothetical protein
MVRARFLSVACGRLHPTTERIRRKERATMAKLRSLSEQDVEFLRAELAAGRTPTVWFTPSVVGMTAGRSAKVVAFNDPAEGDFIQVRPTGSRDVLSFSPGELTLTKPPRKKAAPASRATSNTPAGTGSAGGAPASGRAAGGGPPESAPASEGAGAASGSPVAAAGRTPSADRGGAGGPAEPAQPARRSTRSAGGSRRQRPAEVTVTLSSTADGEWTVDVVAGKKRAVRAVPVPASAVARAAKELTPEVAEAIEAVLEAARVQQRERVEQLRAELDAAQRALAELSG